MRVLLSTSARARSTAGLIAGFLEFAPQLPIQRDVAPTELFDGAFGLLIEIRLAAIEMVEAARDLARDFHVRGLVLAHRHQARPVQQDVGALQQRDSPGSRKWRGPSP
jgi:hypothetical protein